MRNIWVVHLLSFYVLVFKYRIRGDILGDNSVDISFSARAYVHPNDEKTKKNSPETIICPVIQTTWWYQGLLFRWNFVFGTCICSHKLWEDIRKMPREHHVLCNCKPRDDPLGDSCVTILFSARVYVISWKDERKILPCPELGTFGPAHKVAGHSTNIC